MVVLRVDVAVVGEVEVVEAVVVVVGEEGVAVAGGAEEGSKQKGGKM